MNRVVHPQYLFLLFLFLAGCGREPPATDLVWAVNVGGPAYTGIDGTRYEAENSIDGGQVEQLKTVLGSQDAPLYFDYREGDVQIARKLASGLYDVTFHFAEPDEVSGGERIFDALIEGDVLIEGLDVMASRDGKIHSALTVTVPNVEIADGELNIAFEATEGQPVLSALVVRNKQRPARDWKLVWSDEFDYQGPPDPERWEIDIWPARKVNDEDQAYTDPRKKPASRQTGIS